MPNPPKPVEQKRLTGNPGKRPLPAAGSLAVVPAIEPEDHELAPDVAMDRVLDAGVVWLATTDSPAVTLLRETLEERADLRRAVMMGHGKRTELRELDKQVQSLLSQLGFDPTARSRLGLAEVKAASKLEELRRGRGG